MTLPSNVDESQPLPIRKTVDDVVAENRSEPDSALLDRLQLITQQPLSQRAQSLNQLHQQLSQLVD